MKSKRTDGTKPHAWRWKAAAILRMLRLCVDYDHRRAFLQRELADAYQAGVWRGKGAS